MVYTIEDRVQQYWTQRAHDFGAVRKNELGSASGRRWLREIEQSLPSERPLEILDVGTGTGFFAVLLAQAGHHVEGIDLTPSMLEEAEALCAQLELDIPFRRMDAQALDYGDSCFDVVLSRNLTWTLPDPEQAYREWFRVLRPGGVLLNFDADYAAHVRSQSSQNRSVAPDSPYGHVGMTDALQRGKRCHHPLPGHRRGSPGLGSPGAHRDWLPLLPNRRVGGASGAGKAGFDLRSHVGICAVK